MITPQIFKANDIRGVVTGDAVEWDADGARLLGSSWVQTLGLTPGAALVMGRDMRSTSPELSAAFASGVTSRGVDVIDIGLASTDGLWFASGRLDLPGVMFTASHNPATYNGVKFCLAQAIPVTPDALIDLQRRALDPSTVEPAPQRRGTVTEQDLLPAYVEHLLSLVDLTGNRRLTVVADAGNGMAGHTLPSVFADLDAELIGLFTDLDGTFPNHPPNPLEPQNLVDAQRAVVEHHADVGLVFDGDADRCFIIDERGEVVSPSAVTALIATQELAREPGATIVCNLITSKAVPEIVAEHGGQMVTTRVGHTFVKAAMAKYRAIFGGEHSAHYYFRDFWGADTGMLAALHVLAVAGRTSATVSELVADYTRYHASGEINSTVPDAAGAMAELAKRFADRGTQDRTDGLTVEGGGWWFNVRASNTEPLLRLNVEAVEESTMAAVRDEVLEVVRRPEA